VVDAVGERAAQLRPGFEQQADGLADLDRAGPVIGPWNRSTQTIAET
jgi:hypothetical protein